MHTAFISRCLELAEQGRGHVSPNPLVGCVLVQSRSVLTEGYHKSFGSAHAERMALINAGELARGATLYVNLEPCCEAGKQPPCTDTIISAGITRVVFGARDPSNQGAEALRKKGIEVIGPVMEAECRRFNRGFFSLIEKGRPWVTVKKALHRDGSVPSEHVTSEEQDQWTHVKLRALHDAILVGSGTIIADNPQLNVRPVGARGHAPLQDPRRIILDPHNEIPPDATILTDSDAERTLVINKKLSIPELLEKLKEEGIASVLVEGGPRVWESFEESGYVDEEIILVGNKQANHHTQNNLLKWLEIAAAVILPILFFLATNLNEEKIFSKYASQSYYNAISAVNRLDSDSDLTRENNGFLEFLLLIRFLEESTSVQSIKQVGRGISIGEQITYTRTYELRDYEGRKITSIPVKNIDKKVEEMFHNTTITRINRIKLITSIFLILVTAALWLHVIPRRHSIMSPSSLPPPPTS